MHTYRRKVIFLLIILNFCFALVFVISLIMLRRHLPVFSIGIPYDVIDWLVMILSVLSMGFVVRQLVGIERHHEYENRISS